MASVVKTSRFTPPNHSKDINHVKASVNGHPPHLYPPRDSNHIGQTHPESHPQSLDPKVIIGNSTSNSRTQKPPLYPQNGRCGKGSYPPSKPLRTPAYPGRGRQNASMVWRRRGVVCPSAMGAWNMRPCCSEWRSEWDHAGRGTTHGEFRYKRSIFFSPSFTVLMFPSALTADDVCCVYWQRGFSESVNELQRSSLLQKRVYVCVWWMCVCVCVCVMSVCGRWRRRGRNVSAFVDVTWFPSLHYTAKSHLSWQVEREVSVCSSV